MTATTGSGATGGRLRIGLIQMTSTADRAANLDRAATMVRRAASDGARLVALPENFSYLRSEGDPPPRPEPLDGETVTRFSALARDHAIWLLLGSIPEDSGTAGKIHNTSVLLRPDGSTAAVYRKIHLFDVAIPGEVELRESDGVEPGDELITADTPWGRIGLSVCYDLRFPELYRALAFQGATMLFVPAAFTSYTGRYHWEALLRARAIENQCYVAAPAQSGRHSASRSSWGRTTVVDPWGEIVASLGEGEGILAAELDPARVEEVRRRLPCLSHARAWLRPGFPGKG
jgi:predicted amidohydrolase